VQHEAQPLSKRRHRRGYDVEYAHDGNGDRGVIPRSAIATKFLPRALNGAGFVAFAMDP
jgi:hypothetical protein